jgi:hypothetical protein
MAKRVVELDDEAVAHGQERVLDCDFIAEHTAASTPSRPTCARKAGTCCWPNRAARDRSRN